MTKLGISMALMLLCQIEGALIKLRYIITSLNFELVEVTKG